jgi:ectoine hydroxylase-related dioxygenase (phytanoyl-CoA dioxygenase family)
MSRVTAEQQQQFQRSGYFVMESALSAAQLEALRADCARGIERIHVRMDAEGTDTIDISHRNTRYFVSDMFRESPVLRGIVLGDLFADICRATIGDTAYLFLEQFVVKAAEQGLKFGWHQDSGYLPLKHKPYVTCWVALDDVNERNGAIAVLPYERAGGRERIEHWREPGTNDMIGYSGADPGITVRVPAGSVIVFSSTLLHRSGPNTTATPRRAWIAQYSPAPILYEDGRPRRNAVPFLERGRQLAG